MRVGGRGGVGNGLLLVYYSYSNDCNLDQEMDIGDNDYSKGIFPIWSEELHALKSPDIKLLSI